MVFLERTYQTSDNQYLIKIVSHRSRKKISFYAIFKGHGIHKIFPFKAKEMINEEYVGDFEQYLIEQIFMHDGRLLHYFTSNGGIFLINQKLMRKEHKNGE